MTDDLLADLMLVRAQILAGNVTWAADFLGMLIRWSEEDQAMQDKLIILDTYGHEVAHQ